jgi:xanthine/CO dehydrogenase XdhC/CoxF family maturation factor
MTQKGTPRELWKMFIAFFKMGLFTIGGGLAEARAAARAAEMLKEASAQNKNNGTEPVVMKIDMAGNDIENSDMICGGVIEVMLEIV